MGIGKFWYFMEKSKELSESGEEDRPKLEKAMQPFIKVFEQGIKDLKNSVLDFEKFDQRLSANTEDGKLSQVDLKMKLFVEEFFDTEIRETLSKDFQHYDLKDNEMNNKFISE
jgi:hypothetical protein